MEKYLHDYIGGAYMPIVRPKHVTDAESLITRARIVDPDDRERLLELAQEAEARPGAAVYETRTIDSIEGDDVAIGDVTFHARPLTRLFKSGMTVYPYVATCGPDMAGYGDALTDVLERYWWDLIMQGAVGYARNAMLDEIEKLAGYKPISANPGSIQMWPISNQPALFSLIGNVDELIGVKVAPSFLMVPLKSVSGIFFQGEGEGGFTHNCCLCERENCPGRKAPFDPALKAALESDM